MKQLTDDLQDRVIELLVTSLHFTPSHEPNIAIDAQAAIRELRALPDVPAAQPERAPLSIQDIADAWGLKPENIPASDIEAVREIEAAHGIKQGGQHD